MCGGIDREQLLEKLSSCSVGHDSGQMGLKLGQFRRRPAICWPVDTRFDPATDGTTKSRKPHPDLTEGRGDPVLPVVFDTVRTAIA